jgi:hypothetical protein
VVAESKPASGLLGDCELVIGNDLDFDSEGKRIVLVS